jgi:hypothetical protein
MFDRDTDNTASGMSWRASTKNVYYTFNVSTYEPCYIKLITVNTGSSGKDELSAPVYYRIRDYNGTGTLKAIIANTQSDQEMFISPASNIKKMTAGEGQHFG